MDNKRPLEKVLLSQFRRLHDVDLQAPRDKGNQQRDDEVPAGTGQVFPPLPEAPPRGSGLVHLPTTNPP